MNLKFDDSFEVIVRKSYNLILKIFVPYFKNIKFWGIQMMKYVLQRPSIGLLILTFVAGSIISITGITILIFSCVLYSIGSLIIFEGVLFAVISWLVTTLITILMYVITVLTIIMQGLVTARAFES